MTEVEQLRAELNKLRERVAVLESRNTPISQYQQPMYVGNPIAPHYQVTCTQPVT